MNTVISNSTISNSQINIEFAPPLNVVPTAASTGSVARKLRREYTGNAFRCLRVSDDDELDIGFLSNFKLNESQLTSFLGSSDGLVKILYSQDTYGINSTQGTKANMPKIATAGVIEKINGMPAMKFDGNQWISGVLSHMTNTYLSAYVVVDMIDSIPSAIQSFLSYGSASTSELGVSGFNANKFNFFKWGGEEASFSPQDVSPSQIASIRGSGANNMAIYKNGQIGDTIATAIDFSNDKIIMIGKNLNPPAPLYYHGWLPEILLYAGAHNDQERLFLSKNQMNYYSI